MANQRLSLLDLPPELQLQIHSYLAPSTDLHLLSRFPLMHPLRLSLTDMPQHNMLKCASHLLGPLSALMLVHSSLHDQIAQYLYGTRFLEFHLYSLERSMACWLEQIGEVNRARVRSISLSLHQCLERINDEYGPNNAMLCSPASERAAYALVREQLQGLAHVRLTLQWWSAGPRYLSASREEIIEAIMQRVSIFDDVEKLEVVVPTGRLLNDWESVSLWKGYEFQDLKDQTVDAFKTKLADWTMQKQRWCMAFTRRRDGAAQVMQNM